MRAHLEPIWSPFGAHLEPIGSPLGAHLEPIWSPFGAHLEPIWSPFGAHWEPIGSPFGAHLEPIWSPFWAHYGSPFGTHYGSPFGAHFLRRAVTSLPVFQDILVTLNPTTWEKSAALKESLFGPLEKWLRRRRCGLDSWSRQLFFMGYDFIWMIVAL